METLPTTPASTCPACCLERDEDLVLEALPTIQHTAAYLAWVYGWAAPRIEADDLVQLGCLACVEGLAYGLHCTGNPVAYLVVVARNAMRRYCGRYASLVATPRKRTGGHYPRLAVLSLDAPVSPDSERTLLDVLPADGMGA